MPKVVLFALGEKGHAVVRAAVSSGFRGMLAGVVVGRDKRVQDDFHDRIVELCETNGVRFLNRGEAESAFAHGPAFTAIAAGWRWLIHDTFRQLIVFHDSLLPKYRGFNPLVTALLQRDPLVGVTAILANKDFDRGDVIDSISMPIEYPVKIRRVITEMGALYYDLAAAILTKVSQDGIVSGRTQNEAEASYSVWRDEDDYRINWTESARDIAHFIDCVSYPYQGASTVFDDDIIRILDAEAVDDVVVANRGEGKVLFIQDGRPIVVCGSGLLAINEAIERSGRSILPLNKFRVRFK